VSNKTRIERARARAAELQAAQARARQRRRAVWFAVGAVVAVVVVLGALVLVKLVGGGTKHPTAPAASALSPKVLQEVTQVPPATLDAIGADSVASLPHRINAPPLTADGRPRILYVGAEYCPFCAAERWPVVAALSRFGSWRGLGATRSAHDDVFPDTATLSFHAAAYTSAFLSFTGVETASNVRQGTTYAPLDQLAPADKQIFDRYDAPPYVSGGAGSIPFVILGGKYVISGASFSPGLLAGKDQTAIAAALRDPSSPIARSVDGTANLLTAALCELTGNQPAAVCGSKGVLAAKQRLDAQK
jgi:hypothetical protein